MAKPATQSTALWVIRKLTGAGHHALLAGGCVRDMLLGHRSHDYDVATNATPRQVRRLFDHVLLIGEKFGVAMVIHDGRRVEVATFRSDESYTDGRRPDRVTFTTAREDALRRDFTVNGMFYDPIGQEVIDYVGGRKDLDRRVIRTIGKADDRFQEDYLRMLRAVRFSVRLGFELDGETAKAIERHAGKIVSISGERVFEELSKMLGSATAPQAMTLLGQLGLAGHVLGEIAGDPIRWQAAQNRVAAVAGRKDVVLALAALLLDASEADIARRVRGWGASNELRTELCLLAGLRDAWPGAAEASQADFKRWMACGCWEHLRAIWAAQEKLATGGGTESRRIARRARGIDPRLVAPAPLVDGQDLKALGLPDGPKMGAILRDLYTAQLNEEFADRKAAMAEARRMVQQSPEPTSGGG